MPTSPREHVNKPRREPPQMAESAPSMAPVALEPPMPKSFVICLAVSVIGHVALLALRWVSLPKWQLHDQPTDLRVVYEQPSATLELQALQERIQQATKSTSALPGVAAPTPQIRIPDRPMLGVPSARLGLAGLSEATAPSPGSSGSSGAPGVEGYGAGTAGQGAGAGRSLVIDLTNLAEAAQGDPVLLSYFGVIRDQIQRAANRNTWMTGTQKDQGIVFLSFVLTRKGRIDSVEVVPDRSVPSTTLHDIGITIIKSAGPFPPFPPSLSEPAKTVVVPLEFLWGTASQ